MSELKREQGEENRERERTERREGVEERHKMRQREKERVRVYSELLIQKPKRMMIKLALKFVIKNNKRTASVQSISMILRIRGVSHE